MTYLLLFLTILSNAVMDAIMSNDAFAKYGKFFSRDGWQIKYTFCEWLNRYLPLWISKLIAFDFLVVFTEFYKLIKMIMIISFLICIFGFTLKCLLIYFIWGLLFSIVYYIVR